MTTTVIDIFEGLGQMTWQPLWVPMLVWTVLVLPLWVLLERTERLHPFAEYRLSQLLLAALPVGILAAGLSSLLPASPAVSAVEVSTTVPVASDVLDLPTADALATGEGGREGLAEWQWIHAVGLLTVVALALAIASLGRLVLDAMAAARVRATAGEADDSIQAAADRLADHLGLNRPVHVRIASEATVPITLGGRAPTILLPPALTEKEEALHLTLFHECIHIRRYDDAAQLAERIVAALFAVHPMAGLLQRYIADARERACDATVLSDEQTSRSAYAQLLATFAEKTPRLGRLGALSLSESSSSLTNRLRAMRSSVSQLLSSRFSLGAVLLGTGIALTLGVAACSDSTGPFSQSSADDASLSEERTASLWTPIQDARLAGDEWVELIHAGETEESYEKALPMLEPVDRMDWASWVERRQAEVGALEEFRLATARPNTNLGPSDNPSVMLHYVFRYETGEHCQPMVVMVLEESSWKVGGYGPPSCSDLSFPSDAASRAVMEMSSANKMPEPVGDQNLTEKPVGTLNREIDRSEVNEDISLPNTVAVAFVVDENGNPTNVHAEDEASEPLASAAVEAVRELEFEPGHLNGESVRTQMNLPVMLHFPDQLENR